MSILLKNIGHDRGNTTPPPPKQKLKDFFYKLKDNRQLMVAELKMVCAERCCMYKAQNEEVKPVNLVTAVKQQIEGLAAQVELNKLSDKVKEDYKVASYAHGALELTINTPVACHRCLAGAHQ